MEKESNPVLNLIKEEWKYLGSRKKIFFFYAFLFVIASLINLLNPLIIGLIFNSIQEQITTSAELKRLFFMISLLLFTTIGFWIFHGIGRVLEQKTGFFVHRNYTNSKINKILLLPMKWQKDHHSGDTIDKVRRSRDSLKQVSSHATTDIIYSILRIFGSLIILLFIDWKVSLFAFIYSMIVLFIIFKLDRKLIKNYKKLNQYSNKLASSIFDYLSNMMTVITLRLRKRVSTETDRKLMASYKTEMQTAYISEAKWAFASISISLMTVLALIYRAYTDFTTTGIILIGTLYMLYGYLNAIGQTFYNFASMYSRFNKHNARVEGAYPIDKEYEKIKEMEKERLFLNWRTLNIKNLDFSYNVSGQKMHLENVNFNIERGQKIALVGESGSGKSTILALLRGLYTPKKGEIYCNGQKIENGMGKIRHHVTLIPQDPELFNNSIRYNITMGFKTDIKELNKAIRLAQLNKVISRLPKKLDTNVLEKGVSLSGGEKQRLALARGLLTARDSDILLLDEPTSSVDSLNETKIHKNIFKEFKDTTIISSIHKLNLLNNFDYIYLFNNGKIVAEGTLKDIKKNSQFQTIWNNYRLNKK
jgi:ATP-binding cassette, subfamily B, bacterial